MTRFQGSSSISSAEYFGRDEGMSRSSSNYSTNLNAPDMDDVKESVRQVGVSVPPLISVDYYINGSFPS